MRERNGGKKTQPPLLSVFPVSSLSAAPHLVGRVVDAHPQVCRRAQVDQAQRPAALPAANPRLSLRRRGLQQDQVLGFDVAVDDPRAVQGVQRLEELGGQGAQDGRPAAGAGRGQGGRASRPEQGALRAGRPVPAGEQVGQRDAALVLPHQPQGAPVRRGRGARPPLFAPPGRRRVASFLLLLPVRLVKGRHKGGDVAAGGPPARAPLVHPRLGGPKLGRFLQDDRPRLFTRHG